ncbi:MAG: PucR family transcriptional regulator, purine catabolism regulatory protein, partial [Bacillota bacterium]|nr:PucR family transcriptional regulator, purine catabolism regulatory protein [Bacillota bacterium]
MAITVREALTLGPLVHSAVLAGASGLDRVIKTVTVLEAPDSYE